jgi:putative nucleotidyltransferase with HDIG domain
MGALDAKDRYTAGHCSRVTDYALKLGTALGLSEEKLNILEEASLFHDIGKIGVPEVILNKKEALSNDEFEIIKKHSAIGADIITSISTFKEHVAVVRHHHERWDGRGYPNQLKGEDIPLESRILAVADTFDAMTSDRPYRARMPKEKALAIIRDCIGSQFDPEVAKKFLEII